MPQHLPLGPGDPGRVGRYRIGGRISGIPAEDPIFIGIAPDGTEVFVSMLSGDWATGAAARDRFAAEAAAARRVPPFCAARVLDAGLDAAGAFLVSEYVPGPSLLEIAQAGGLGRGYALEATALGTATGLAAIHQAGLVHGSFGPEYVVMPADGSPRVIEFGITPPYGSATPSADMLAWAQTVTFAATGRPAATWQDLDALPVELRGVLERCLHPEPAARPSALDVVASLLGQSGPSAGLLAAGARQAERAVARRTRDQRAPDGRQAGAAAIRDRRAGQRTRRRTAHAAHGRRSGWLVAGALVAVVLVGAFVAHLMVADHSANGRLSADARQDNSPGGSPASSPSRGLVIPGAFAGTWSGRVSQPPADTYNVSVSVAAGVTSGSIRYSGASFSCSGKLTLVTATSAEMTLSQDIVTGRSECGNGQVTLTELSSRSVRFSYRSDGPVATGTLARG